MRGPSSCPAPRRASSTRPRTHDDRGCQSTINSCPPPTMMTAGRTVPVAGSSPFPEFLDPLDRRPGVSFRWWVHGICTPSTCFATRSQAGAPDARRRGASARAQGDPGRKTPRPAPERARRRGRARALLVGRAGATDPRPANAITRRDAGADRGGADAAPAAVLLERLQTLPESVSWCSTSLTCWRSGRARCRQPRWIRCSAHSSVRQQPRLVERELARCRLKDPCSRGTG